MLLPHDRLLKTPIMSLQTGTQLAAIARILVDPRDLTIAAYELEGHMLDEHPSFLRPTDVRELSSLGLIVDSSDEFVGLEDVIRIKQVRGYNFNLIGIDVFDDRKTRLGKVQGFNLDSSSFSIQQIVVKRPLLRSFGETELLIHRSQIIEVQNHRITVSAGTEVKPSAKDKVREFTNPFRTTGNAQPESIEYESRWP